MDSEKKRVEIGDVLIVAVAKENREWEYNPASDGTRLRVTGFNTRYRGRVNEFGRKPGKYIFNDSPITVTEDGGDLIRTSHFHLRYEDGSAIPMDLDGTWVADLPELPFWEGDFVNDLCALLGKGEVVIARIDYDDIHTKCTDGVTPYPIYTIAPTMAAGISTSARQSDLSLVKRGNIWKYYHEEPLHFESVSDEAQFYDGQLGRAKEVRNEAIGLFAWTIEEAVKAVRAGKADAISVSAGLFGSRKRPYVKKFVDEDVGARVRMATLEGWKDFDPSKFADEIAEELKHREEMKTLFNHRGKDYDF